MRIPPLVNGMPIRLMTIDATQMNRIPTISGPAF